MKTFRSTIISAGLLFAIFSTAIAQTEEPEGRTILSSEAPTLRFEHLGLEDGMAQTSVRAIMQDSDGYLWMATEGGLHRYNGHEFEVFTSTPYDTLSMSNSNVYGLTEAADGNLWVTTGGGLNRMEKATDTFTHYRHDPDDPSSLPIDNTNDVLVDSNGDLWVTTWGDGGGLSRMRKGEDGVFTHFFNDPEDSKSLTDDRLLRLSEDSNGYIWAGGNRGINRIDPETGEVTRFLYESGGLGNDTAVSDQYHPPEEPAIVWLATANGLVRLNSETGEYNRYQIDSAEQSINPANQFRKIVPDPADSGIFWLAGSAGSGVVRFDVRTEAFTSYQSDPRDPNSLADNSVLSIFADRSGTMWAGTQSEGLSLFNPRSINFSHLRHNPDDPTTIAPGYPFGIYEDQSGTLWVNTIFTVTESYINRFDAGTGRITRYQSDFDDPSRFLGGGIRSFTEDADGQLWFGSGGGLHRFNPADETFSRFFHEPFAENLSRNDIFVLVPTSDDSSALWVGSQAGLYLFDLQTETYEPIQLRTGGPENETTVRSLYISAGDSLWIGTVGEGLFLIPPGGGAEQAARYNSRDTTSISRNIITVIVERDREPGILWLGTNGGGLNRFDTRTGTATHYMEEDGLANNVIYGILEDESGTLWISTNLGISNFNPEDKSFRNYGLEDGLISLEYNGSSYAKGSNGILYFGGIRGVTAFNPSMLSTNTIPPQVVISDFRLFNESVLPGPDSPLKERIEKARQITIAHDQSEVAFEYAGLHYSNPSKNGYKYQLVGFDEQWVDAGNRRTATYTNLSSGEYTFRVQASNADGVWNEEGASLTLTVLPPWYRTWWAYGLYFILFVCGVFIVDKVQRKRLLKKEREKAREKELEQAQEIEKAYNQLEQSHEELKAAQNQLVQQEKLASLGQLTAGIAHEIKNPLNFVNNFSDVSEEMISELIEALGKGDIEESLTLSKDLGANLKKIHEHGSRADSIVQSMLMHSRGGDGKMEPTPLNPLVKEYVNLAFHGMRAGKEPINVDIDIQLDESIGEVPLVAEDFSRVILNLSNNAFDAMREKQGSGHKVQDAGGPGAEENTPFEGGAGAQAEVGDVTASSYHPKLTVRTKSEANTITIEIEDNGPGIPDDIKDKILQPFFTTKKGTEGTGLGLSITNDIINAHGGELTIESKQNEFSIFKITLPA